MALRVTRQVLWALLTLLMLSTLLSSTLRLGQATVQRALDPSATTVVPAGKLLSTTELGHHAARAFPTQRVLAVHPPKQPDHAARVVIATPSGREPRYLDPYTGKLLARPKGRLFFNDLSRKHNALGGHAGTAIVVLAWVWLYRRREHANAATRPASDAVLIAYASQTGHAEEIAHRTAEGLRAAGLQVDVHPLGEMVPDEFTRYATALFIVSTFGDGDAPDSAQAFVRRWRARPPTLPDLRYGVLALGDRHYPHFCAFGHQLDAWLAAQGAQAAIDCIEVDQLDPAALAQWQSALTQLCGMGDIAWQPSFAEWQLSERICLNPDSAASPVYRIVLVPPAGNQADWQAGDTVDILPRQSSEAVQRWLDQHTLDGTAAITTPDGPSTLAEWLAACELPASPAAGSTPQALADSLHPLSPRAYSLASLPSDGCAELLVRQVRLDGTAHGALGLGSGWLTAHAPLGGTVAVQLRRNPGFHLPAGAGRLILIGNGTGLAGLRAHIKAAPEKGHWLIFGERRAQHDFLCRDELEGCLQNGTLARLDTAFSRDQAQRIYVQDVLREQADRLVSWIDAGATVLVCGSASGMAPAVHTVLEETLGADRVAELVEAGRYRRDVY